MNNLLSYCGLVDARISASEKILPVLDLNQNNGFGHTLELTVLIYILCLFLSNPHLLRAYNMCILNYIFLSKIFLNNHADVHESLLKSQRKVTGYCASIWQTMGNKNLFRFSFFQIFITKPWPMHLKLDNFL
jgi:hypothetical protein